MKTGLVLEGGGLRGIFSAGVLDVLMEEGVKFDGAIGVSAGAAFGSNYKSGQNRRSIRYNLRFAKDPRYSSVMSLIATGNLFNAQFCYHDIPEKLDPFDWEAFRENPMEFYLVCTDVETGKPVYHLCDNDSEWKMLEWFRASGSMPLVSRVVEIEGKKLLDGGISDSIPLRFMEEQGYERNVVILTRPADYVKKAMPMMTMFERGLHGYPEAVEAIRNRHIVYNEQLAYVRQREAGKFAFVIRPDHDLDIGRVEHDRTKIRAAYKAGRRKGRRLLPEILRFLEGAEKEPSAIKQSLIKETAEYSGAGQSRTEETAEYSGAGQPRTEEAAEYSGAGQSRTEEAAAASPSPAEEKVKMTGVVRPSLVEDPSLLSDTDEESGKSYEEAPEEIFGRENKDVPEELLGKVDNDMTAEVPGDAGGSEIEAEEGAVRKEWESESRSVLIPEPEEDLPAFRRPFPMDKEQDPPFLEENIKKEEIKEADPKEDTTTIE